jgi:hypothetical protein
MASRALLDYLRIAGNLERRRELGALSRVDEEGLLQELRDLRARFTPEDEQLMSEPENLQRPRCEDDTFSDPC